MVAYGYVDTDAVDSLLSCADHGGGADRCGCND